MSFWFVHRHGLSGAPAVWRLVSVCRRPFQFDGIAFRVIDIERRPVTARTIALLDITDNHAVGFQVRDDRICVPGIDLQAEVVHVRRISCRCRRIQLAQVSVDVHQVNQRLTCTQLVQTDAGLFLFNAAAEYIAVKGKRGFQPAHPNHHMIDQPECYRVVGRCDGRAPVVGNR